MNVHLVDGTYELFRNYFGAPPAKGADGREVGAVSGLVRTLASLLREDGVSHVALAFDHVIESFRNQLFNGYKTSAGVPPALLAQFDLAEQATHALGIVVWSMVEFEADDAMATGAARLGDNPEVDRVFLCTPDKDLSQCVRGTRIVRFDRRRRHVLDEDGVRERFGISPESIPDWLALVGDPADGIPGVPRWGEKSASAVLARYRHLEDIPDLDLRLDVPLRGAQALIESLRDHREEARLYRSLATLRTDVPLREDLEALRWRGPDRTALAEVEATLGQSGVASWLPQTSQ